MICGIDPGLSGAFTFLSNSGTIVKMIGMPTLGGGSRKLRSGRVERGKRVLDLNGVLDILETTDSIHVFLEKVASRPGQGVASTFTFGRCYGAIEGMLVALQIPYTLVHPATWTKEMHQGIEKQANPKETSMIAASRRFPGVKFTKATADSTLIAEYGRQRVSCDATFRTS